MSGADLQACTGGCWRGAPPERITGLSSDSRAVARGEAFIALRGEHFDGHDFAADALRRGAAALIGDAAGSEAWQGLDAPQLQVPDTLRALGDVAAVWRNRFAAKVVAISGSYGKTTLRSMLRHVLGELGVRVAATRANDNNLIGVPQTLLAVDEAAEVALVECGISERGEMQRLAAMVRPDVAVLTGIAPAHGEGLGDVHQIAREKGVLLDYLTGNGCAVLGDGVAGLLGELKAPCLAMDGDGKGIVRWRMQGTQVTLRRKGQSAQFSLPLPAAHLAADAALAATVLGELGMRDLPAIATALQGWRPVAGRLRKLRGVNGCLILDDCYNANPASMAAALDTLRAMPGRRLAVLGDMAELGEEKERLHAALDVSGIDVVIAVGGNMRALARRHPEVVCLSDCRQALAELHRLGLGDGDVLLVKGSRCMRLEEVVDGLTQGGTGGGGHAV